MPTSSFPPSDRMTTCPIEGPRSGGRRVGRLVALVAGLFVVSMAVETSAALFVTGYTPETNDRFTNHPSFIAGSFNLGGIGQTSSGQIATAVSANVVIGSWKNQPTGQLYFFEGNNPTSSPIVRNILSPTRIAGTDLFLGVLDSALPTTITPFNFTRTTLSGPPGVITGAGPFAGVNTFVVGTSNIGPGSYPGAAGYTNQRVGQNRVGGPVLNNGFVENLSLGGFDGTNMDALMLHKNFPGEANFVQYEAWMEAGDEGAPVFMEDGGKLTLLGTNLFNWAMPTTFVAVSFVGNSATAIDNFIQANTVPEPMTIFAVMAGAGTLGWHSLKGKRRRRKSRRTARRSNLHVLVRR